MALLGVLENKSNNWVVETFVIARLRVRMSPVVLYGTVEGLTLLNCLWFGLGQDLTV